MSDMPDLRSDDLASLNTRMLRLTAPTRPKRGAARRWRRSRGGRERTCGEDDRSIRALKGRP